MYYVCVLSRRHCKELIFFTMSINIGKREIDTTPSFGCYMRCLSFSEKATIPFSGKRERGHIPPVTNPKSTRDCMARQCWSVGQHFGECSIFNPTFIGFEEAASYWSVQFVQFILCSSLVTSSQQISDDSDIFRQHFGIKQSFIS